MSNLWRPDTEWEAVRRRPAYARLMREMGFCNLHTLGGMSIKSEGWSFPVYTLIGRYQQNVADGRGKTISAAIANGLLKQSGSSWPRQLSLACRLACLELLAEDMICTL